MEGMGPPSSMNGMGSDSMSEMHMTFFWGKNVEILFSGWPGRRTGMYLFALILVFVLSVLVEWLSYCRSRVTVEEDGSNKVAAGLLRTAMHGARIALGYMVMLAVMSFNVGVFVVAVAGHMLGFLLFGGARVLKKSEKASDVPLASY